MNPHFTLSSEPDSPRDRGPLSPKSRGHRRGPRNAMGGERPGRRGPREGFGGGRPRFPNEAFAEQRERQDRRQSGGFDIPDFGQNPEPGSRGFGHHGFNQGGFGPGGSGFGRAGRGPRHGRRARRGDVRAAALLVLSEGPANGYQIITALAERSGGRWKPSPGAVYPALNQLEDEGLIAPVEQEGRTLYQLTEAGRTEAAQAAERPAPWVQPEEPASDARDQLAEAAQATAMAVQAAMQTGDELVMAQASEALVAARKAIYQLLAES